MANLRLWLVLLLAGCGAGEAPIDFGTPSGVYPAGHAPLPSVQYFGGPVQEAPVLTLVTVAGDPFAAPLADFLGKVGSSSWWGDALGSYGVGPASFGGAVTIAPPAATIDHGGIAGILDAMLDGTHPEYGVPSLESNYVLALPEGVSIVNPGGMSCRDFGGYHGSLTVSAGSFAGVEVPYSVIPRCPPGGTFSQLDALTFVISHELAEAASNPLDTSARPAWNAFGATDVAWNVLAGGEIADICQTLGGAIEPADLGYMVSSIWSNRAAAASHDPCQPSAGPYFGAAPLLSDTVAVAAFSETALGALIPVGSAGEIELDIFSDGPTSGPITIGAEDAAASFGRPANLAFAFDRRTGVNGEKVHLTVSVRSAGTAWGLGNAELFYVTATQGVTKRMWPVLVGNDAPR